MLFYASGCHKYKGTGLKEKLHKQQIAFLGASSLLFSIMFNLFPCYFLTLAGSCCSLFTLSKDYWEGLISIVYTVFPCCVWDLCWLCGTCVVFVLFIWL